MLKISLSYIISDNKKDFNYQEQVFQACSGGADVILLDDASLKPKDAVLLCPHLKGICKKHKVLLMIKSRVDIAYACDVDGVHLNSDDISPEWAKQILGPRRIIGFSAGSLKEALSASEARVDYISVGPMYNDQFQSDNKTCGLDIIRLIKKRTKIPVTAFGGININNVDEIIKADADGAAVSSLIFNTDSIYNSVLEVKQKIMQTQKEQEVLSKE